ncbi:MAG: methylornithine synthase PylB [Desulfobacterales bacterium]|nr:methylornithine synthase PylB [Desulfobacterales bacterium]
MSVTDKRLISLLDHLVKGGSLAEKDVRYLLNLSDPAGIRMLFDAAVRVRARHFGTRIFLYGFLYFSTFCRNNCRFCQYRKDNTGFRRYRKTPDEILAAAREMADSGVHLIDLTMGEDPAWHGRGEDGFAQLVELAAGVRTGTGLPVMISPGVIPDRVLGDLAQSGVQWYACYQETHNRELYASLRRDQAYDERWEKKQLAKASGMLVEEGILTGVGESSADIAGSILKMRDLPVDQARVMTFVPQPGTPMADVIPQDNLKELIIIAVMRLILQDCLIPASLDVDGLDGLGARLAAGANVVTSIVPPEQGLAGVANHSLDIEASRRSLAHIIPVLESCGLEPASAGEYKTWVQDRQALFRSGQGTAKSIRSEQLA